MNTRYNFQVRKRKCRTDWQDIKAVKRNYADRLTAILFAQRLARIFKAEIRLTEGNSPFRTSATYITEESE